MSFWQRFLHPRKRMSESRLTFELDREVLRSLQRLADREQRSKEKVAAELLALAVSHRQMAEDHLQFWRVLSPREQQVAALVCMDFTYRQIASRLAISRETVKTHMRNIKKKTGLHSRADLRRVLSDWDFSAWSGDFF